MGGKNKNILITGISGFVGSLLARELIDRGANVYGLVRRRSDGQIPYNIQRLKIEKGTKGGQRWSKRGAERE